MFLFSAEVTALRNKLGDYMTTMGGEYRFNCPFCETRVGDSDSGHHLYVNPDKQVYNCFRCGSRGPLKRILELGGFEATYTDEDFEMVLRTLTPGLSLPSKPEPFNFPCDVRPVVERSDAWHYLYARKMSTQRMEEYGLVWGYYNKADRIFFPVWEPSSKTLTYWVARKFQAAAPDAKKYVNPIVPVGDKLFNLNRAINYDTLIITEGPMSAIAAGDNAIATLGKAVTLAQRDRLARTKFKEYVVALDGDARREAISLAQFLMAAGKNVSMVEFKLHEDPASVDNFARILEKRIPLAFYKVMEMISNGWVEENPVPISSPLRHHRAR